MQFNGTQPETPVKGCSPAKLPRQRFMPVAEVARELGLSEVTLYRAIHGRQFPAIKIRGRFIIPGLVLDAMEKKALETWSVVDAADWVDRIGAA